jgi:hypothetical protein
MGDYGTEGYWFESSRVYVSKIDSEAVPLIPIWFCLQGELG